MKPGGALSITNLLPAEMLQETQVASASQGKVAVDSVAPIHLGRPSFALASPWIAVRFNHYVSGSCGKSNAIYCPCLNMFKQFLAHKIIINSSFLEIKSNSDSDVIPGIPCSCPPIPRLRIASGIVAFASGVPQIAQRPCPP